MASQGSQSLCAGGAYYYYYYYYYYIQFLPGPVGFYPDRVFETPDPPIGVIRPSSGD